MEATPEQEHPPTNQPVVPPVIELPALELPAVELPAVEPVELPAVELPAVEPVAVVTPPATVTTTVTTPVNAPATSPENPITSAAETAQPPAPNPIKTTVEIPASDAEGGEWQLLQAKLNDWFGGGKAADLWGQSKGPLKALGLAILVVVLLRLLGAVLGTLEALPLLPGLLELVGLLWLTVVAGPRLLRSEERKKLLDTTQSAWKSFRGGG